MAQTLQKRVLFISGEFPLMENTFKDSIPATASPHQIHSHANIHKQCDKINVSGGQQKSISIKLRNSYPNNEVSYDAQIGYARPNPVSSMSLILDNRTQTVVQVAVSTTLFVVMFIAWRTQKTYPGFGRWTLDKVPSALGWLLISLRGQIPDWASVPLANALLLISPILTYEGIRQFRGKSYRDLFNYLLLVLLLGAFSYFTWARPDVNARVQIIAVCALIIFARCGLELFLKAPRNLRSSYWLTAGMFMLYVLVLLVRVVTSKSLPNLRDPFQADVWESILFMATTVASIGWTFGCFMMTNERLTLELGLAEAEMRQMAATDFLTGALNRRSFSEMSQREYERARRYGGVFALLILDIDHFKKVNDTYGHLAGDVMLQEIVRTLRANLRAVDILARWGGEEFAILLPDIDDNGCQRTAERLLSAVAGLRVPSEEKHMQATISIGGALWLAPDETIEAVLRRADTALYQAKQRGRNCVVI